MLFKKILFAFFLIFPCIVFADDKMVLGLDVYNNKAQCGTCHTLQSAGSTGDIGPNLDQINAKISRIISVVTDGIGVMPPWEGVLSEDEIEAVAYFVFKSTNK